MFYFVGKVFVGFIWIFIYILGVIDLYLLVKLFVLIMIYCIENEMCV